VNKTIYLPDDEAETWEKARRLANDRLSPVILRALKEYIMTKEAEASEAAGFERIELEFEDSEDCHLPRRKAFIGRWIIHPGEPFPPGQVELPSGDVFVVSRRRVYAVAVTAKGKVVVYTWMHEHELPEDRGYDYKFLVFQSFEAAAQDPEINSAIREAVRRRGVPVEELDI
jgi:hypothetical protein